MTIEEEVISIIAEQLAIDPSTVTLEKKFVNDLEADSLDLAELVILLKDKYDCSISESDLKKFITVGDVVFFVKNYKGDFKK
jgi:acyl carrier protein